jgi:tRNA threonylcarbamoyladenosine biosynthesis protein TsaB
MLLLALDTSTRQASIALCSESELYGEYTWHVGNNHSVELLENVRHLMAECQTTLAQIDAVAVATGPGSFNGVRVALATAKALAFSLKKSLVGVSSLDILAARQQQWRGPVCAVQEAGRSELYAACYLFDEQNNSSGSLTYGMRRLSDYLLLAPQQLVAYLQQQEQAGAWRAGPEGAQKTPLLFCGELSEASRQTLYTSISASISTSIEASMQEECRFVCGIQASRQASVLAMLALRRLHEGKVDDPLVLEPLYLRRPSITKSARKQPLLDGGTRSRTDQTTTEREEGALRH